MLLYNSTNNSENKQYFINNIYVRHLLLNHDTKVTSAMSQLT